MKDVILVISANPYDVTDEKTGKQNEGISISYCMTSDVLPVSVPNGLMGYRVMKGSIPKSNLKEFTMVPAFYEADFDIKPDSSGKPVLKPTAVKFKKALAG